jgi:hypothetical protein
LKVQLPKRASCTRCKIVLPLMTYVFEAGNGDGGGDVFIPR